MAITLLTVFTTVSLCAALAALGYALYTGRRVAKIYDKAIAQLAGVDKQIADAIERITPDVQGVLDTTAEQQSAVIEELAKVQSEALEKVIQKQSEINKDHKGHIERLDRAIAWHNKILKFEADLPVGTDVGMDA